MDTAGLFYSQNNINKHTKTHFVENNMYLCNLDLQVTNIINTWLAELKRCIFAMLPPSKTKTKKY